MSWRTMKRKVATKVHRKSKKMTPEQIEAHNKKVDEAANAATIASDLAWGGRIIAAGGGPVGIIIGGGMIAGRALPLVLKRKNHDQTEENKKRKARSSTGETVD